MVLGSLWPQHQAELPAHTAAQKLSLRIADGAGSCERAHERGKGRPQSLTTQRAFAEHTRGEGRGE